MGLWLGGKKVIATFDHHRWRMSSLSPWAWYAGGFWKIHPSRNAELKICDWLPSLHGCPLFPTGAQPPPAVPACSHSMFSCNLFQTGWPFSPSWVRELGLFSELRVSHQALRLRTECPQVNYLLGPSSWGSAYAPARIASQGPEHLVSGTYVHWQAFFIPALLNAWLLPAGTLWAAFSWTAQDGQCLLDWGVSISYPFNAVLCSAAKTCSVSIHNLVSFLCLAHPSEWGQFQVLGHFLLLPHPLAISNPLAIPSWDRVCTWIIYIFTLNAKITERYFKLSHNIFFISFLG